MKATPERRQWERLFREVEGGGAVRDVAARRGVNERTLAWWCSRLRRERREGDAVQLLPVVVRDAVEATGRVAVVVGDLRVVVEAGADPAYVAALVAALRAAC